MPSTKDYHTHSRERKSSWLAGHGLIPPTRPQRIIALASFINMMGSGVFMVSAALFYTRVVGLSVARVGLGMGIAATVGLVAGIPVGHLADRRGPREVYRLTLAAQALAMAALVLVRSFGFFVLVVIATQLAISASTAARAPIVRGFGGPDLVRYRAYLRSVANLAGCLGGIAAGLAIQVNTRDAYEALVLVNALSYAICAVAVTWLPPLPPVSKPAGLAGRWIALRDRPYIAVSLLDGIMWIQGTVLVFAVPLWIVDRTHAPRWVVGVAVVINTAMVVALQVRASRGIDSSRAAGRAMRRAGVAFLIGMALIAVAARLPAWLAAGVLVAGIAVHTIGELWHAAGSLELRVRLAPAHAQGQYSGVFGFGRGLGNVVAPAILGLLCITWGVPGWLLMGAVFVAVGLAMPAVSRWAERTRPAATEAEAGSATPQSAAQMGVSA
ncbi:MAG TPA: MFS transporter [Streptosporangiaceae bacterium]